MSDRNFTVYVLHAAYGTGPVEHYVGCTRTDRLQQRLKEHRTGNGADATARMVANGKLLALGAVMYTTEKAAEFFVANATDLEAICHYCCEKTEQ